MANKCTFKMYRGYYDDDGKEFTPTKEQKAIAKEWYEQMIKLSSLQKVKFSTKQYKDLEKIWKVLMNRYFPYYDVPASMSSGKYDTYTVKGKNVAKAIIQNQKIKQIVADTVVDIGITKKHTQREAVELINKYFIEHYTFLMYGYNGNSTYDKLLMVKKNGICQDYAYAFYLLASYCGIKVGQITCWYDVGHAFNCVDIDGNVSCLDTCWNNKVESKYMWLTREEMEVTSPYHKIDYLAW